MVRLAKLIFFFADPGKEQFVVIRQQFVSCQDLLQKLPHHFSDSSGDLSARFQSVASPENASQTSILFLAISRAMEAGFRSEARIWVVGRKAKDAAVLAATNGQTVLVASNVERAMADTIQAYFLQTPYTNRSVVGVHPSAIVAETAELASDVRIGPNAFIGSGVKLGAGCYIGACSVIEDGAVIGAGTTIHPNTFIGHSTLIGERCEVHPCSVVGKEGFGYSHDEKGGHHRIPHQGRVVLEDDVHIGANNTIDRGTFGETRICRGAKLDNRVHIAHNCVIGRNALLTAGFAVAGSTRIGANFISGGNASVTGHVEICDNVQISGTSGVTKNITQAGQYGGYPLMPLQKFLRTKAAIVHLVDLQKQVRLIMKHLGLESKTSPSNEV